MQTVNHTFEARAARLGHDIAALQTGQTITTEITVPDIDHFKSLVNDGRSAATGTGGDGGNGANGNPTSPDLNGHDGKNGTNGTRVSYPVKMPLLL